jgi:hypothetical protein
MRDPLRLYRSGVVADRAVHLTPRTAIALDLAET